MSRTTGADCPVPLTGETLLTITQAAAAVPSNPEPRTVRTWISSGVLIRGGRVKLESVRIGSRLYTSREAIERFLVALQTPEPIANGATTATQQTQRQPSSTARSNRPTIDARTLAAIAELRAKGFEIPEP